jgi:hypothetical protein
MTAEKRQHENTLIRPARAGDAPAFGQLLHAFNAEFGQSEPDKETIVNRAAPLIESGEVTVLFAGEGPNGFAQVRFRPLAVHGAFDAYPRGALCRTRAPRSWSRAGFARGRHGPCAQRGAARIDLNTSVDDVAAHALYEGAGFTNRELREMPQAERLAQPRQSLALGRPGLATGLWTVTEASLRGAAARGAAAS